jgi:biotin carboxyl carrier protein
MQFETIFNETGSTVTFNEDFTEATVGETTFGIEWASQGNGRHLLRIGYKLYVIDDVIKEGHILEFRMNGSRYRVEVKNEQDLLLERLGFRKTISAGSGAIKAPMPGKILELLVAVNDEIKPGDPVVILEAMKMENELKSPESGVVSKIHIQEGDSVEKNQPILEIEPRG